jgi:hypothetical protein
MLEYEENIKELESALRHKTDMFNPQGLKSISESTALTNLLMNTNPKYR